MFPLLKGLIAFYSGGDSAHKSADDPRGGHHPKKYLPYYCHLLSSKGRDIQSAVSISSPVP